MRLALAVKGFASTITVVMSGMKMALIEHLHPLRSERLLQLLFDAFLYGHYRLLDPYGALTPEIFSIVWLGPLAAKSQFLFRPAQGP